MDNGNVSRQCLAKIMPAPAVQGLGDCWRACIIYYAIDDIDATAHSYHHLLMGLKVYHLLLGLKVL